MGENKESNDDDAAVAVLAMFVGEARLLRKIVPITSMCEQNAWSQFGHLLS